MKIPTKAMKTRSIVFFFPQTAHLIAADCVRVCVDSRIHNANVFRSLVVYSRLVGLPELDRLFNIGTMNEFPRKHIMADIVLISNQEEMTKSKVNQTNIAREK